MGDATTKAEEQELEEERVKQRKIKEDIEKQHVKDVADAKLKAENDKKERLEAMQEAFKKPAFKPRIYRNVEVPVLLVGGMIGSKGSNIKALQEEAGLSMQLCQPEVDKEKDSQPDPPPHEAYIKIGPVQHWQSEDLDKAEALVLKKMEELKQAKEEQQAAKGKAMELSKGKDRLK